MHSRQQVDGQLYQTVPRRLSVRVTHKCESMSDLYQALQFT